MERKQALTYTGIAFFVVAFMVMLPVSVIGLATDMLSAWKTIDLALVALFVVIFIIVFLISKPEYVEGVSTETPLTPEMSMPGTEQKKTEEGYCPWCGRYIGFGCPPKCPWCGGDLEGKA